MKTTSFEAKLTTFQEIINTLDSGELPLEEQVKLYEKGMKLAKELKEFLEKAEMKIVEINKNFEESDNV